MSDLSTMTAADWTVVAVAAAVLAVSMVDLFWPRTWDLLRAMWHGRGTYGWQDWTDRTDRAAMVRDWNLHRKLTEKGEG